ncbi:hypothetical protein BDN71DRAFT_1450449 [Pleurotus eryngii]|uniref:Uncharacterized protein n=1 Tax=Pleurotus eryngii TaxID=5323 RepID=A0A9P5ZUC7_PLEER|nr:hypothetical protein BDN71DRAFT_1450449 [Pleurotus eryngii]
MCAPSTHICSTNDTLRSGLPPVRPADPYLRLTPALNRGPTMASDARSCQRQVASTTQQRPSVVPITYIFPIICRIFFVVGVHSIVALHNRGQVRRNKDPVINFADTILSRFDGHWQIRTIRALRWGLRGLGEVKTHARSSNDSSSPRGCIGRSCYLFDPLRSDGSKRMATRSSHTAPSDTSDKRKIFLGKTGRLILVDYHAL